MNYDKWYQIWVSHEGDAVKVMKNCEPLLMKFGAFPNAPVDMPVMQSDNTIEVRAFTEPSKNMAKRYLTENGFTIVRELENGG